MTPTTSKKNVRYKFGVSRLLIHFPILFVFSLFLILSSEILAYVHANECLQFSTATTSRHRTPTSARHLASFAARLLLAETNRLLDSPRELLRERVIALVRRQIETVEARVRLGQL
jgi:hypothetical protein